MKPWFSLKFRIALIIFLLEAVMMALVLWGTLGYSLQKGNARLAATEQSMLTLVGGMSRVALLTEEYAELLPYIEGIMSDPHIVRVLLADSDGRVVASTQPSDVGKPMPPIRTQHRPADPNENLWRTSDIANSEGRLGTLAIEFSHRTLLDANAEARNLGLVIAVSGMLVIAIAGVATGHLLTRRLERLTAAADSISKGDLNVGIDVGGSDEIGRLAGSFKGMVASVADSERRLREQADRFKLLLDSTGEGIFGLDREGNCSFCNAACLEILGYERAEQLLGRNMHRLIHHSTADGVACPEPEGRFARAYRGGESSHAADETLWRADGSHLVAEYRAVPLRQDDAVVGAVISFVDVTQIRQIEAAQRRSQRLESVAHLTGGIAHDFNNILGIAIGNLELLEEMAGRDPEIRGRLERVQRALERGAKLTKRLLMFSADMPQPHSPVDLNGVIGSMEDLIARSLTPRIAVELDLADGLWTTEVDPGEFEDVLINLALNGRDAMGDAGKLVVRTRNVTLGDGDLVKHPEARSGDYVAVTVSDNGSGIPGDIVDRIFEPFFTTKERGKGTGLGLSLAYGFVTRLKGVIDVNSEPGIGTSVSLYFPRAEKAAAKPNGGPVVRDDIPGGGETVLIVEDEPDLLNFAANTLTKKGYRVLRALSAAEAMDRLESSESVDLLFSDVVLAGGQSGLDLALQARAMRPDLKVLMTSGYTDEIEDPGRYGGLVEHLLQKPYRGAQLAQQVRATLNGG